MKTRIVHTKVWSDDWFSGLCQTTRFLFLYLITNESIGLSGIYEISDRKIMFDTGLSKAELEESKKKLSEKVDFYKGWVKIKNSKKYNKAYTESSKNQIALGRELGYISDDILIHFDSLSEKMDSLSPFGDSTINHKSEIINDKSEIKNQKSRGGNFEHYDWVKEFNAKRYVK